MPDENAPVRRIDLGPVTAYAIAKAKGFPGTEDEWNTYIANASLNASLALSAKDAAIDARDAASQKASDSEAYALGTRDGESVPSTDVAYQNNAKYYSEQAAGSQALVSDSEAVVLGAKADVLQLKADVTQLKTDVTQLKTDTVAAQIATQISQAAAAQNASDAEAWARGYRDGTPVTDSDPAYHKNSKYYSDMASATLGEVQVLGDSISEVVAQRGNRLYFDEEEKLLYLMSDDVPLGDGIAVSVGGGGGGGGGGGTEYTYTVTLDNLMENRTITIASGASVILDFSYSSVDADDNDDGPGVGTISVSLNNVTKRYSFNVPQGHNTIDIKDYLGAGMNIVKLRVDNSEGRYKTINYTVTVVELSISSSFPTMSTQISSVQFSYIPFGTGLKTIHFVMDGTEIDTAIVSTSAREQTFMIPAQTHGAHIFECYSDLILDGQLVRSKNTIRCGILFVDSSSNVPIILTTVQDGTIEQGDNLIIPYILYNPLSEKSDATFSVISNGEVYSSSSGTEIDRSIQTWKINDYPTGNVIFRISTGTVGTEGYREKNINMIVTESTVDINPVTDNLTLLFDPAGRSNNESNPSVWEYGNVEATFSGFGWKTADGWLHDDDGASILRILPGDSVEFSLTPFATNIKETGYAIEVEMATRDVRDYETVVLSCVNGGRGFVIKSQQANLSSESANISMIFKEDSKVRISFVVENQQKGDRFIYVYINGIMCGVTQYLENDTFRQPVPVGIEVGAETCAIDLYKIRCYSRDLAMDEIVDNFIADRPTISERKSAAERNDIYDSNKNLSKDHLPINLPYMVIKCPPPLPIVKATNKDGVEIEFVDKSNPSRSWTATNVRLKVQGTSSEGYPVKNYTFKLNDGITYTADGRTASGFMIGANQLPTKTICFKADFASCENANNVILAKLYNDVVPYKTQPQLADSRIRQGIDGFGIALFWENTDTGETIFLSKGNCNIDKGNNDIFGFDSSVPYAESWEFKNSGSSRVLFKGADFSTPWGADFEARYPKDSQNIENFASLVAWVASTDRSAVDDQNEKDARLQKFKDEFDDHFVREEILFYYLFTELFLMIDSRAKNMFMTTYDGQRWFSLPYDFDTAIGINNEGALVFDYNLEDTDYVNNSIVFNGQSSVLWNNVRDAFSNELKAMYQSIRGNNSLFSYESLVEAFKEHQSVWPEALWNEDEYVKYISHYKEVLGTQDDYLGMLQGSKESQRDWWLYNAFRYRDSKYQCGDASAEAITIRPYALAESITLTAYAHIYGRIDFGANSGTGQGYNVVHRMTRNVEQEFLVPRDFNVLNDVDVHIYSADRLSSVGDLSPFKIGMANFGHAKKLQRLKIGDEDPNYENRKLGEGSNTLTVGSNELLTYLNIANCTALGEGTQTALDMSGCTGIKEIIASGTKLWAINLPNGGHLETLKLPSTIRNFTILNQPDLTTLTFDGYGDLTTLRVENTPNVPIYTLISSNPNLDRVRLVNVEWTETDSTSLAATIEKLKDCYGMSVNDTDLPKPAVVIGRVNVPSISGELLLDINEHFPELVVVVNNVPQYLVKYYNYSSITGEFSDCICTLALPAGSTVPNIVTEHYIDYTPTRPDTADTKYVFADFGTLPTNIQAHTTVHAVYSEQYLVTFMNDGVQFNSQWVNSGSNASMPSGTPIREEDARYSYTFAGWSKIQNANTVDPTALLNISEPTTLYAVYTAIGQTYTVTFYNGLTALQSFSGILYGGTATYTGPVPVHPSDPENYEFIGFNPTGVNISGDTACYATWRYIGIISRKIINRTISVGYENSTISYVGTYAFQSCASFKSVSLPEVLEIDSHAFTGCPQLKSVYAPKLQIIGEYAFHGCVNLRLGVFSEVTYIGDGAFYNCYTGVSNALFPEVTSMGTQVFAACSMLTNVSLPKLLELPPATFYDCRGLYSITLPEVSVVYSSAFTNCSHLVDVSLPKATVIGYSAFINCTSLSTIMLPEATNIAASVFCRCLNLKTVSLPKAQNIGAAVFSGCSNINTLVVGTNNSTVCSANAVAFIGMVTNTSLAIYVPDSLVASYKTAVAWSGYSSRIHGISELIV